MSAPARFTINIVLISVSARCCSGRRSGGTAVNLFVLVLVGMVLASLFGSLSSFASRLLSPNDFLTLQDVMFASFTPSSPDLPAVTTVISIIAIAAVVPLCWRLDVVDLGHDPAVALAPQRLPA